MLRNLMEPDPEADPLPLVHALWLIVLVLAVVLVISLGAPAD
jgi:hypothetical protein